MSTSEDFFDKARIIAKQLDWMAEKGYESHPITGNEPTYEDRMNNEPVAWTDGKGNYFDKNSFFPVDDLIPLYTHPAKTLTDEEILSLTGFKENPYDIFIEYEKEDLIEFARAILKRASEK